MPAVLQDIQQGTVYERPYQCSSHKEHPVRFVPLQSVEEEEEADGAPYVEETPVPCPIPFSV